MKKIVFIIGIITLSLLLLISCDSSNSNSTNNKIIHSQYNNNISNTTTQESNYSTQNSTLGNDLSEQCTHVFCEGYLENIGYLKIIVNQVDAYPDSTYYFGVIKNNEWLIEPTTNCPFLDDNGRWVGLSSYSQNSYGYVDFNYIGAGCFLYESANAKIVYKPETNIHFKISSFCYADPLNENYQLFNIMQDEFLIAKVKDEEANTIDFYLHNMNTGEKTIINFGDRRKPTWIHPVSEGLFMAYVNNSWDSYFGFFDTQGNLVIDLSVYGINKQRNNMFDWYQRFKDGKYTFVCGNTAGVLFKTTIDKTGKIIEQKKVDTYL